MTSDCAISCLLFFLNSFLNGDREELERMKPLVKLLPKAIPLGEKRDEPGPWVVLVA